MSEMKTVLDGIAGRLDMADETISTHEDTATETIRNENGGKKGMKRTKHNISKLWDFKWPNRFVNVESLKSI